MLRQRCVDGLGVEIFEGAHRFLKALQDAEESGFEVGGEALAGESANARLVSIMGPEKVHFASLIDQVQAHSAWAL